MERDITGRKRAEEELRRAEERMRSVVDHVIDGIITIDELGAIDSFNPAAEKLFGYSRAEVLGQNVKMLMPECYHPEHDGIGREVVGKRKDGVTFPMELAVSEFHIGERRFFTGIVRDITERKRLESQLHDVLAMLSHELRNPLAPMRNALYLIKRSAEDPLAMETACDVLERQMHQLVRLVDDLLDVSRIIRGKIDLRRDRVELAAVVNRAVETAQPAMDAHGHTLDVGLPVHPLEVEGDLVRLSQVLSNLLMNAAKYSGKANRISVTLRADAGAALICVRDYGAGIPAELLPRVFDLFVQGENTLARSPGGLGIGLTLVKRLVEMHGGAVSAQSDGPGHGSEFRVRLPLAATRRPRLLVVDDNVDAAETIAKLLRLSGFDTECVYDGPTALAAVQDKRPDVVVLDIGLPGMDGYEVARRLRAQDAFRRTPLIAVTGYGQENDRQRSVQAGFDEHFTKPVDPEALERFIARCTLG